MAKWQKGQSGNPRGRPKGGTNFVTLRKAIAGDVPEIIDAMVAAAKLGDVQAAKLLLDRVLPSLKPVEQAVSLPLGGSPAEAGRAVLEALGAAQLTPEQGAKLLAGLGALARVIEVDELEKRIEALEAKT